MTCKPIIFSGPMVRAILDGRKTQTRRVLKRRRYEFYTAGGVERYREIDRYGNTAGGGIMPDPSFADYAVGQQLWVRETWAHDARDLETARAAYEDVMPGRTYGPYYRATETAPDTLKWRSPIHMPRWASRITLEVTDVRVQRLQDITEEDARAEGATQRLECHGFMSRYEGWSMDWSPVGTTSRYSGVLQERDISLGSPKMAFASYWNSIHGPDAWDRNDWVAAYSFRRVG